jgi:hypothetical protein
VSLEWEGYFNQERLKEDWTPQNLKKQNGSKNDPRQNYCEEDSSSRPMKSQKQEAVNESRANQIVRVSRETERGSTE